MHGATKCDRELKRKRAFVLFAWIKHIFMGRTILYSIIMRLATYKATRITDVIIIAVLCLYYWRRLSMAYAWFAAFSPFFSSSSSSFCASPAFAWISWWWFYTPTVDHSLRMSLSSSHHLARSPSVCLCPSISHKLTILTLSRQYSNYDIWNVFL